MESAALDAFIETAQRVVYCSLATVDRRGRPRSRLVHAVWERDGDRIVGWVGSRPTPLRRAHLARNPFVSCFYWDPAHDVAAAECEATWIEDDDGRRDGCVALRLDPWRVQAKSAAAMAAGEPYLVWTA